MLQRSVEAVCKEEGVHDWLARHICKTSTQYYVIGSHPESRRQVQNEKVVLTIMNDHTPADGGQGKVRGEAELTVLPGDLYDEAGLQQKLSQTVFTARLADNPLYGLPAPSDYPTVDLADPVVQSRPQQVAKDLVQGLLTQTADQ